MVRECEHAACVVTHRMYLYISLMLDILFVFCTYIGAMADETANGSEGCLCVSRHCPLDIYRTQISIFNGVHIKLNRDLLYKRGSIESFIRGNCS
jgi:hypothetical protein